MTLREALQNCNREAVYRYIHSVKDSCLYEELPPLEKIATAYGKVIDEMLSNPSVPPYHLPIHVKRSQNYGEDIVYIDVCHSNPTYEAPAEGLKPWGGFDGNPIPEGHYDCNADKHNQYFAIGFAPWSKIIDTPIENSINLPPDFLVAEILWELTFYGWTQKEQQEKVEEISKRLDEARKDLE